MDSSIYELQGGALRSAVVGLCHRSAKEARRLDKWDDESSMQIAERLVPPFPKPEPPPSHKGVSYYKGMWVDADFTHYESASACIARNIMGSGAQNQAPLTDDDHAALLALRDGVKAGNDEPEVCVSSTRENPCGPVVTSDSEGTPLCAACAWELDRVLLRQICEAVGYSPDRHEGLIDAVREKVATRTPAECQHVQIVPVNGWYLVDRKSHVFKQSDEDTARAVAFAFQKKDPELGMFATQLYYLAAADRPSAVDSTVGGTVVITKAKMDADLASGMASYTAPTAPKRERVERVVSEAVAWLNVYERAENMPYPTKEDADRCASRQRVGCAPLYRHPATPADAIALLVREGYSDRVTDDSSLRFAGTRRVLIAPEGE